MPSSLSSQFQYAIRDPSGDICRSLNDCCVSDSVVETVPTVRRPVPSERYPVEPQVRRFRPRIAGEDHLVPACRAPEGMAAWV